MPYKVDVLINTKNHEYEQSIGHVFDTASELAKAIKAGLNVGEGLITSTVLTILYVPKVETER